MIPKDSASESFENTDTVTDTKLYHCDECGKEFAYAKGLAGHKRLVHGEPSTATKSRVDGDVRVLKMPEISECRSLVEISNGHSTSFEPCGQIEGHEGLHDCVTGKDGSDFPSLIFWNSSETEPVFGIMKRDEKYEVIPLLNDEEICRFIAKENGVQESYVKEILVKCRKASAEGKDNNTIVDGFWYDRDKFIASELEKYHVAFSRNRYGQYPSLEARKYVDGYSDTNTERDSEIDDNQSENEKKLKPEGNFLTRLFPE